jgi:hypothetical protein
VACPIFSGAQHLPPTKDLIGFRLLATHVIDESGQIIGGFVNEIHEMKISSGTMKLERGRTSPKLQKNATTITGLRFLTVLTLAEEAFRRRDGN